MKKRLVETSRFFMGRANTFEEPTFRSVPITKPKPSAAGSVWKGHLPAGERFGAQPPHSGGSERGSGSTESSQAIQSLR